MPLSFREGQTGILMKQQSIHIDTGNVNLLINDDESRVLSFCPTDVVFAEKFYRAMAELKSKAIEYQNTIKRLGEVTEQDKHGLPVNSQERIDALKETCVYIRDKVDHVFGDGTAHMVFGDAMNIDVFIQFFEQITPHVQRIRSSRMEAYVQRTDRPTPKRVKRPRKKA
jgi:hypothetical protein